MSSCTWFYVQLVLATWYYVHDSRFLLCRREVDLFVVLKSTQSCTYKGFSFFFSNLPSSSCGHKFESGTLFPFCIAITTYVVVVLYLPIFRFLLYWFLGKNVPTWHVLWLHALFYCSLTHTAPGPLFIFSGAASSAFIFRAFWLLPGGASLPVLLVAERLSVIDPAVLPSSCLNRIDWLVEWSVVGSEYYTSKRCALTTPNNNWYPPLTASG